jgi:hypothetical protein
MNEVAQELLRRSRDRKVPWEEKISRLALGHNRYQVIFPEGALILTRGETEPTEHIEGVGEARTAFEYELALLGETGRVIDSLNAKPEEPMNRTLEEIFELAQGYVRDKGINKALDFLKSR